jgi:hypothetical protein
METDMSQKISGLLFAGLLLVAGGAAAAPVSTNETASSPHAYQGTVKPSATDGRSGATGPVFPVSASEVA